MSSAIWKVTKNASGIFKFDFGRYAVLILNRPITISWKVMVNLWDEAIIRATVDGGTDRWYNFLMAVPKTFQPRIVHPDLVTGDLDSIKPETLQLCKENEVTVINTPDQDKTDFTKSLEEIFKFTSGKIDCVIAVAENSGRLDHIMSNLHTLYNSEEVFGTSPVRLYLLSSDSLTWLLPTGSHTIHIPSQLVQAQATCGLIPLGAPCVVTTTGLKWNLNNDKMEFGGLISTCNTYSDSSDGTVTVTTDLPLLWTMNLAFETHGDS